MLKVIALSALVILTPSSCRHLGGDAPTVVLTRCPTLKNYSKQDLQRAAKELEGLKKGSEIYELLNDYGQLREACRTIQNRLRK